MVELKERLVGTLALVALVAESRTRGGKGDGGRLEKGKSVRKSAPAIGQKKVSEMAQEKKKGAGNFVPLPKA